MKKIVTVLALLLAATTARAQSGRGFAIERYEPTPAGEWSFWVDHPWYTRSKYFAAAGLTLDYANKPLVFGTVDATGFQQTQSVIEHQLAMHLDIAGSFLDRVNVSLSLPVVLLERGTASNGVAPLGGGAVGDPRIGAMVRVFGQPLGSAISVHLGAFVWIPIAANDNHAGDAGVRFMPKLALGGFTHRLLWSFTAAYEYRANASIGALPSGNGNTVGSELQFGAGIAYADFGRRFAVGPEAIVATVVSAGGGNVFASNYSSFEVLAAGHYNVKRQIQLGLAAGVGLSRAPGTPDARVIFRIAYAPLRTPEAARRPDRDGDGIVDAEDACPDERGLRAAEAAQNGCPARDRDGDGVLDAQDLCPDQPAGPRADPARPGCPEKDSDGDGIVDSADLCPTVAAGPHPDAKRAGCADVDTDG
ncbi:MAG: outer membrane protein, partial [Myxococcales bacterium]|nr:outer membrane protein [Myxococcales bacterium]